jgi:hypothetical protein
MNSTGLSSTFLTTCSQHSHSDNVSQDELTWKDKCNRLTRGLILEPQRIEKSCDAPPGSVARVLLGGPSLAEQRSAGPIGG